MTQIMDAATIAAQGNQPPAGGGQYAMQAPAQPTPTPPVYTPPTPALQLAPTPVPTADSSAVLAEIAAGLKVLTDERNARSKQDAQQGVYDAVAGKAGGTAADFAAFNKWASQNMDPAQIAALNSTLTSGDPGVQSAMIAGYAMQFRASQQTGMIVGNPSMTPLADASQGYLDAPAFTLIMKSEKYKTDPGYAKAQDDLRSRSIAAETRQ